jgi:hypothetical protein
VNSVMNGCASAVDGGTERPSSATHKKSHGTVPSLDLP